MIYLSGFVSENSKWQCVKTNSTPSVHIKIAGLKWMFIPLKMVLIDIDPYPNELVWQPQDKRLGGCSSAPQASQFSISSPGGVPGVVPSGYVKIAIENSPIIIIIVSFPMKNGGYFHSYVNVYQRVPHKSSKSWMYDNVLVNVHVSIETHSSTHYGDLGIPQKVGIEKWRPV